MTPALTRLRLHDLSPAASNSTCAGAKPVEEWLGANAKNANFEIAERRIDFCRLRIQLGLVAKSEDVMARGSAAVFRLPVLTASVFE